MHNTLNRPSLSMLEKFLGIVFILLSALRVSHLEYFKDFYCFTQRETMRFNCVFHIGALEQAKILQRSGFKDTRSEQDQNYTALISQILL